MDYIEEKTPGGVILKVLLNSWNYIAFDKNGRAIYADESGSKVLHKVPVIVFMGQTFRIITQNKSELAFCKIARGKIIVPYTDTRINSRKYLFIDTEARIDQVPVRIFEFIDVNSLVNRLIAGLDPDYIIVDNNITKNDIIVIKNRHTSSTVIQADANRESKSDSEGINLSERAVDITDEQNLNIMSNNPVFLARVHLRKMELSKVNQLLLDFDISSFEAEYMLRFIESMTAKSDENSEIRNSLSKLNALADACRFYILLVNKNDKEIKEMIKQIAEPGHVASYSTLVAKVKQLFPGQENLLLLTEYENLLFERKDQLLNK